MTEWHSGKKQQIFAVTHQHGESIFVGHRVEGAAGQRWLRRGRGRGVNAATLKRERDTYLFILYIGLKPVPHILGG
jgi:hypothetical protein